MLSLSGQHSYKFEPVKWRLNPQRTEGFTPERADRSADDYLRDALERNSRRGSEVQLSP